MGPMMLSAEDDFARLRAYIDEAGASGEERLPAEPRLCEELGLSRGRLRTLLRRLESEGVIWRHVGKGTFIGPRQANLDDTAPSPHISADNIMDARLLLEPQLAAQAAIHATPAHIGAMEQCMSDMALCDTLVQWRRLDERLHRLIAESTRNHLLLMLYDVLRAQMRHSLAARVDEAFTAIPAPRFDSDAHHAAIIDAIGRHNPLQAETLMRQHLQAVRAILFGAR
jgi:DNA-binding FadR family transcriptional regulator